MTNNSIEQRLMALIQKRFGKIPELHESFSVLGIDSLAMAEFSLEVEREFDLRLDDSVLDVNSIGEFLEHLKSTLAKKSGT